MSGADLSRLIVETYIDDDQRIVDDSARADLLNRGALGLGGPSARDVAEQMSRNVTLTAADLTAMPALMAGVNDLAFALQDANQKAVAKARTYAQSFTSVFGKDVPASYIDLGNFVDLLATAARKREVTQAAAAGERRAGECGHRGKAWPQQARRHRRLHLLPQLPVVCFAHRRPQRLQLRGGTLCGRVSVG